MGMSYLTSLNTQLFKNIAYDRSFDHILFNLIFNVNSNLAESSANCSEREFPFWEAADSNVGEGVDIFPSSVPGNPIQKKRLISIYGLTQYMQRGE